MHMASALSFTPRTPKPPLPPSSSSRQRASKLSTANHRNQTRVAIQASLVPQPTSSDPFVLQLAETIEDSLPSVSTPSPLQKLRDASSESLLSTPWPSRKDEAFRFTDVSFVRTPAQIRPISTLPDSSRLSVVSADTPFPNLVIVDGHLVKSISNSSEFPSGVYVGSLSELTSENVMRRVSEFLTKWNGGDLFWSINGLGAPDLTVVYVPEGCRVENPIHLTYLAIENAENEAEVLPISNPRVLLLVEKGGEIDVIEEFSGGDGKGSYWTNSAIEIVIAEGGKVRHSYIQSQSLKAAHIKWTSVLQESFSTYELVEVSTGGKLSRHNVHIEQTGPQTVTDLSTLHLVVGNQTQDLHSRLILNHPRGRSQQLHKCIISHSQGQAVFDGNVKVNRYAQETDAGQLTRSLLLEPNATVNVKPNLQIVANDVKCSHGAAISDLEEDQLVYFRARGIDLKTAKRILTFSFGGEVIERLRYSSIKEKVKVHIKQLLEAPSEPSK